MKIPQWLNSSPYKSFEGKDITIPSRLNLVISVAAYLAALFFLWATSHFESIYLKLVFAVGFALVGNTIFSLLHESVHRILHHNRKMNDVFGQLSAMFFPTGFHFQRAFHLGHHRRNRTDVELFEQYGPNDSKILKFLQLYTVLLGFYWLSAPFGALIYIISPNLLNSSLFRSQHPWMKAMSIDAMLSGLDNAKPQKIRWELVSTLFFQIGVFWLLNLNFLSWILCYWSFAVLWGSLQYADHAWSVRDIRNGAWNLKVNRLVHYIFLSYHHHLAHHQHPYVSWIHLKKFVDFQQKRPTHLSIWLKMWKGPTPLNEGKPIQLEKTFEQSLYYGLDGESKLG